MAVWPILMVVLVIWLVTGQSEVPRRAGARRKSGGQPPHPRDIFNKKTVKNEWWNVRHDLSAGALELWGVWAIEFRPDLSVAGLETPRASRGKKQDRRGVGVGLTLVPVSEMAFADPVILGGGSADLAIWQLFVVRSALALPIRSRFFVQGDEADA